MKKKILIVSLIIFIIVLIINFLLFSKISPISATLIENDNSTENLYNKYDINMYTLDYFTSTSGNWLPWNWIDGGKQFLMTSIHEISAGFWYRNIVISSFTGYLIQEIFELDILSNMSSTIGTNMQNIVGVSSTGISPTGLYFNILIFVILILGIYVTYGGLIKAETSKAFRMLVNFCLTFVLTTSFLAYAPKHMENIIDFSRDINKEILSVSNKLILSENNNEISSNNTDTIRNSLFEIQVYQPWLLLQFGTNNINEIENGEQRIDDILNLNDIPLTAALMSDEREKIIKREVEEYNNINMSYQKVNQRFGDVIIISSINSVMSFSIFILLGVMLFSEILLILFLFILPIALLLSLFPNLGGIGKKIIFKCFHQLLIKSVIILIVVLTLSISVMMYTLSSSYNMLMIGFIQIVIYVGMIINLRNIFSIFTLNANESEQTQRRVTRPFQRTGRMVFNTLLLRNIRGLAKGKSSKSNSILQQQYVNNKQTKSNKNPTTNSDNMTASKPSKRDTTTSQNNNRGYQDWKREQHNRNNRSSKRYNEMVSSDTRKSRWRNKRVRTTKIVKEEMIEDD